MDALVCLPPPKCLHTHSLTHSFEPLRPSASAAGCWTHCLHRPSQADGGGNLFMNTGYSSSTIGRSMDYITRRAICKNSVRRDGDRSLQVDVTAACREQRRRGDYFASSCDSPSSGAEHP